MSDDSQLIPIETLREVLKEHWLFSIETPHPPEKPVNKASCSCSLVNFPERPNAIAAAADWIEHVIEKCQEALP